MKDKSISLSIALNVMLGAIFTLLLYQVLGIYGDNMIITEDMLRSLKAYKISDVSILRNKLIFRIVMIVGLFVLYLKQKVKLIKFLLYICSIKLGFMFTLFFLEMKIYGFLNYICIISPPYIIYMTVLKNFYKRCKSNIYQRELIFKFNALVGWSIGIIYELVIKLLMVHHCLIISS